MTMFTRLSALFVNARCVPAAVSVRLVDLSTGQPHRINGLALSVRTDTPDEVMAQLMRGRDPARWRAEVVGGPV
ncbi:MAG: hypothetical protein Q4G14_02045 [Paracoccus sp. (in: a-proteobacteria)]|uniref:hypothetical protein n=1 Tax=Paracoccus sp. TaxID=267 RepID=UPI0026E03455|nr:hypothetical protein [Paracoccus sp. (in: a-proteobacteria)]MDO5612008.1 hypothetical protein [Paracoccus sp. (in: a-proteobacteria)]